MSTVGLVASVILGVAFLVAGASKVAAGPAWPATAREMGAPAVTIPLVPWIELAVGAALLARLAAPYPAAVALLLLVAFTSLIVIRLARGEHPACACFGAWSAEPIGRRHVLRNAALIALALVAVVV